MFSPTSPLAPKTAPARSSTAAKQRSVRRFNPAQTIDEAYEMRLLAEVARWDDQAAFEELHGRHRSAVVSAALQICRDCDAAEDVAQQTFTALWVRADRLVAKSLRLRPWLTTVARNAAIDHVRAQRAAASLDDAQHLPSGQFSPEDVATAEDERTRLTAAVAALSPDQRAAVECVYFAGMTYEATAVALGAPAGTIKSRVRLGVAHLRRAFEAQREA